MCCAILVILNSLCFAIPGVEPGIRRHVWPFLLFVYSFESTQEERDRIRTDNYVYYEDIKRKRRLMTAEQRDRFYRDFECTVEKDVVRTDRYG